MSYVDCTPEDGQKQQYRAMNWRELSAYRASVAQDLNAAWAAYGAGGSSRDRIEYLMSVLSDLDAHIEQRRAMARLVYGRDAGLS